MNLFVFRRASFLLVIAYICFTCYSGYLLLTRDSRTAILAGRTAVATAHVDASHFADNSWTAKTEGDGVIVREHEKKNNIDGDFLPRRPSQVLLPPSKSSPGVPTYEAQTKSYSNVDNRLFSEAADRDDWNPWGEDFEPERSEETASNFGNHLTRKSGVSKADVGLRDGNTVTRTNGKNDANDAVNYQHQQSFVKYTVEVWGKAAIGNYLWEHVFAARMEPRQNGAWHFGTKKIGNIRFKYRTGPGIAPQTVPSDVEYLILALNGRSADKISFARLWLDYLENYPRLQHCIVVLLGDEQCRNNWITRYMRSRGGKVDAAFIVYDSGLVDDQEFFQWPLGVATYRGFTPIDSHKLDIESARPYKCNFLGTVYPKSTRRSLVDFIRTKGLEKTCFTKVRKDWLPGETRESLQMYQYALSLSDLTLNPVGFNTECYRIYEAMAFGSVPVIEDKLTPGSCQGPPLRLLKRHRAPVIYVKDWIADLPQILAQEATLSLKEKIERRIALVEWYEAFKLAMRKQLVHVTKSKFGFSSDN